MARGVKLPALPSLQQVMNTGVIVLIVLMVLHFFPQLKFWERFPSFGKQTV